MVREECLRTGKTTLALGAIQTVPKVRTPRSSSMNTILLASAGALLLLWAAYWLVRGRMRSRIHITVNGEREVVVSGGASLYHTLLQHGEVQPSTCGGKGSCAQCRCRVLRGGGRITDREKPYFSPAEIKGKWRLACQVMVHGDLVVELPTVAVGSKVERT